MRADVVKSTQRPFDRYLDFIARMYKDGGVSFGLRNTLSLNPAPRYLVAFNSVEDAKRFLQYMTEALREFEEKVVQHE